MQLLDEHAAHRVVRVASATVVAAVALSMADRSQAQADPYSIGVSQAFAHDSNTFRTTAMPMPDKYSITGLQLGIDQPFGRQRFYANATVRATRYEDLVELNNTGYGVNAGLDWSTIEQLSGGINVAVNQSLAPFGASGSQPQLTRKNVETAQQVGARAQLGLASLLSLDGSVTYRRLGFSAPEFAASESNQTSGSLGVTYRPSGLLSLGAALRATRGEYPNIVLASGETADFTRNDLDLTATWVPTGLSTVTTRLSFGRQTSDALSQRDFSGTTGSINWAFLPTGKLTFNTTLSRDTGAETSFLAIGTDQATGSGDNSRLTTSIALTANYEATAKIRLNAGFRYARRSLVDDQFVNGVPVQSAEGKDSLKTLTIGANYEPTRNWQLGCTAQRDLRLAEGGLSNSYSNTNAHCSAQFTLR